jgi:hypothetical protein
LQRRVEFLGHARRSHDQANGGDILLVESRDQYAVWRLVAHASGNDADGPMDRRLFAAADWERTGISGV